MAAAVITPSALSSSSYVLGLFFIALVCIIWAASSLVAQYVYSERSFRSPFLLTYVGASLFSLWLPVWHVCHVYDCHYCQGRRDRSKPPSDHERIDNNDDEVGEGSLDDEGVFDHADAREEPRRSSSSSGNSDSGSALQSSLQSPLDVPGLEGARSHMCSDRSSSGTIPAPDVDTVDYEGDTNNTNNDNENNNNIHNADDIDVANHHVHHHHHRSRLRMRPWSQYDHWIAALRIAPVWFIANWSYNASLANTSITSSTVLASTSAVFTFLLAVCSGDEPFGCFKLIGVLLGVSGSVLTALTDVQQRIILTTDYEDYVDDDDNHPLRRRIVTGSLLTTNANHHCDPSIDYCEGERPLWGDFLGLVSAIGYAVYAVQIRLYCPKDESLYSMQLILGYLGLIIMIGLSPVAFWEAWSNTSNLSPMVFLFLIIKGVFDNVLSEYMWLRAVVLTSATVATVGLGMTIPLAFLSDVWQGADHVLTIGSITGAVLVLCGFVLVSYETKDKDDNNNNNSRNIHHSDDNDEDEVDDVNETSRLHHHHRHPREYPYPPNDDQDSLRTSFHSVSGIDVCKHQEGVVVEEEVEAKARDSALDIADSPPKMHNERLPMLT